jgi:hypothetical protein
MGYEQKWFLYFQNFVTVQHTCIFPLSSQEIICLHVCICVHIYIYIYLMNLEQLMC